MPLVKENALLYEVVKVDTLQGKSLSVSGTVNTLAGLEIPDHDYISLGYTGDNLTSVIYKTGGSGGSTVATLALTYSGTQLISVAKS